MIDNKLSAITANLVDVRNVATHKCVLLQIHVPYEQAGDVMAAFGWPTMVNPVPVAIARLDMNAVSEPVKAVEAPKDRRPFDDMPPTTQAAIRCNDADFISWCEKRLTDQDEYLTDIAEHVRGICGVKSRSELNTNPEAAAKWRELNDAFEKHKRGYR